jgi:adenine-specific DNA methylase
MAENEDKPRLIERGFCLKQASIDSVHEKNVRHGHISTLHIWPARRPLAACRAALIATLLPDPGDEEKRRQLLERIGGTIVSVPKCTNKDGNAEVRYVEETKGGILRWGNESNPDMDYFREEINKAYGGRAPKVTDPFAGGGAIPLEAMRLGCEATAIDINPVAWFIEKCTLEYPQRLAGQKLPLPDFILENREFMDDFYKSQGIKQSAKKKQTSLTSYDGEKMTMAKSSEAPRADLAWHVKAWGLWVLDEAKKDLARYYPVVDDKPTVAYIWARSVKCKNCRATIPLLKTRWLCKKERKRVLLTIHPNGGRTSVDFGVQYDVLQEGHTRAEKAEIDRRLGQGTMSRNGAWCPCCGKPGTVAMSMEDIRREGTEGRLGSMMAAVVIEGKDGKEYRLPVPAEYVDESEAVTMLDEIFKDIPFGIPDEPLPNKDALGFRVPLYGFDKWSKLFTQRQLIAIGAFIRAARASRSSSSLQAYPPIWREAICAYQSAIISRTVDYMATLCIWENGAEEVKHVFMRWALPMTWDYAEANPIAPTKRFFIGGVNSAQMALSRLMDSPSGLSHRPKILNRSALDSSEIVSDVIFTDPPYYDAIPYSDLMDFFYIWLRRSAVGISPEIDIAFKSKTTPKWDHESNNGELIDDSSRHDGSPQKSKLAYEDGMYRAFMTNCANLSPHGRMVIVFANKNPTAWETLVSSMIRAGFCVTGSWPISSEMPGGLRNLNRASLATSIWLVCRKRETDAKPGWDNKVLEEMRSNINDRLRDYWDAGIRGPDFIWAATGPALEAYSKHPIVKKADDPGQVMTVSEFLIEVRRIVMDFVVGRVLKDEGEHDRDLDNVTTYYLLHRYDFGFLDAPAGSCILYALSCDLSDTKLAAEHDLLIKSGGMDKQEDEEEGEETEEDVFEGGTSNSFRLKSWNKRKSKNLGLDIGGRPAPMIDRLHKLMQLWKDGDMVKVDEYLNGSGLIKNKTFHHMLQAVIELSKEGDEERSLLESISNHITSRGGAVTAPKDYFVQGGK